jgi:hypothetical protein
MSDTARKHPSTPDLVAPLDDEGSAIRSRDDAGSVRPRQGSSDHLRVQAAPPSRRSHSSTRPAAGSRDDRIEQKARVATALVQNLPPTDTRVRLLSIAIMRRDESLLDGVLAELNKPGSSG